jgi:hypothetical protein
MLHGQYHGGLTKKTKSIELIQGEREKSTETERF